MLARPACCCGQACTPTCRTERLKAEQGVCSQLCGEPQKARGLAGTRATSASEWVDGLSWNPFQTMANAKNPDFSFTGTESPHHIRDTYTAS